jgi:predicted acetyltransferase
MLGIAGVTVPPESRARGNAKRLMRALVRDAHTEGWATSALFASTHALYRSVGYEHAGSRFEFTVPLSRIDVREREGEVVALTESDLPCVKACYARVAPRHNGHLDRGDYIWARIRKRWGVDYQGFGVLKPGAFAAGQLAGYLFLAQQRGPSGRYNVEVNDLVFETPAAGRRLLGFLRDFEMMGHDCTLYGGPSHPALTLLPQHRYEARMKDYWLIRVTHIERAIAARGYAPAHDAEVHLHVEDDVINAHNGPWVLRVRAGAGEATRGGRGKIRITARGLAAIYSGFTSFAQGKAQGWCDANDDAVAAAEGVFAGPHAWMAEMF